MSSSYSFSTLYHQKSVLQPRRREHHQQRHALNFIVVQSKHHHHHHRSLRKVQHQHHLKKTSKTSVRGAATTENNTNDDETVMKDVQVTLVDCVASDGAKMTKETRRNAEGSIEEMDNCRFVRHRFKWWTHTNSKTAFFSLSFVCVENFWSDARSSSILFLWVESFES